MNTIASASHSWVRAAALATLCSGVEFYDIVIFAVFASSIGKAFFPNEVAELEIMSALAVFGAGFVARPFGSLFLGAYADRRGRKAALLLSSLLMMSGTAVLAITPSYEDVGFASSFAVVIARLMQGFAFGGEIGPSTALVFEVAPLGRKGLYASWQPASQGLATMVASFIGLVLISYLEPSAMEMWGWRIPFVVGALALGVVFILRRSMPETIEVSVHSPRTDIVSQVRDLIVRYPQQVAAITSQLAFGTVVVYLNAYMNTYMLTALGLHGGFSLFATATVGISMCIGSLIGGRLADAFGPSSTMSVSRGILLVSAYPLFWAAQGSIFGSFLLCFLFPALAMVSAGASFGAITAALPADVRSVGLSLSYAVVVCIFGGSTQIVVSALVALTGDPMIPAYYAIAVTILAIGGGKLLKPADRSAPVEPAVRTAAGKRNR